jgi:DNA-binding transcriptional ArsR family regulator
MASKTSSRPRRRRAPKAPSQTELAKALSHPLRVKLLSLINDGVASPKALADRLDESLSLVSYHVRILRELHCIELVETAPRRGALEHFYRPVTRGEISNAAWSKLPASVRGSLSGAALDGAFERAAAAFEGGTFDARKDRHLSVTDLELDEDGWAEVNGMLDDVLDRARALHDSAGKGGDDTVRSSLVLAHFGRA